ncbi:MAG: DNA-3-methyladenine glycosylase [Myxococcaceae bacterium]|nr:DNA-3-methyladenine glycosylase [Myxococcaceae bacterium]
MMVMTDRLRCDWASTNPLLAAYHDEEWGVPVHDDRQWFAKLLLDGAQAGLSWLTILKRREGYRSAFHDFDVQRVARMDEADVERLMQDTGIIRNRLKIVSARTNALAFLEVQREFGSFDAYIWQAVGGRPVQNAQKGSAWPARTELSDALSKDLKKRGFSFVGSTIVYAFMQASGLVNDHRVDCFRHATCARLGKITTGIKPRKPAEGAVAAKKQARRG